VLNIYRARKLQQINKMKIPALPLNNPSKRHEDWYTRPIGTTTCFNEMDIDVRLKYF
jgi:hypothetical protein